MPKHIQVSPDEDLAAFYGGAGPAHVPDAGAPPPQAPAVETSAPFSVEIDDPDSEETPARGTPPPPAAAPPVPRPEARPMPSLPMRAPYTGPSPVINALISFFLPGVGQILAGQTTKGAVFLLISLCTGCGGGLFNILLAVDAYAITKRRVADEPVGEWQFF